MTAMKTTYILSKGRRYAAGHNPAIIALAIALIITLAIAYVIVQKRGGTTFDPFADAPSPVLNEKELTAARDVAAQIIVKVKTEGLHTYLKEGYTDYFLVLSQNTPIGFAANTLQPITDPDDAVFYKGADFRHYYRGPDDKLGFTSGSLFKIADDLGSFHYTVIEKDPASRFKSEVSYYWDHDNLFGPFEADAKKVVKLPQPFKKPNLIPLNLLDFFSSLAAHEAAAKPADFAILLLNRQFQQSALVPVECYVVPNQGEVPAEVLTQFPGGLTVSTIWSNPAPPQVIYYSRDHKLLWQYDAFPSDEVLISATRQEVLEKFPDAQAILDLWLQDQSVEEASTPEIL